MPGTFVGGGHGLPGVVYNGWNSDGAYAGQRLNADGFATLLNAQPGFAESSQIWLSNCFGATVDGKPSNIPSAASGVAFAQRLADITGKPVIAADQFGWMQSGKTVEVTAVRGRYTPGTPSQGVGGMKDWTFEKPWSAPAPSHFRFTPGQKRWFGGYKHQAASIVPYTHSNTSGYGQFKFTR